jgi:alkanesulfonate monooxygenase SsuD/methylene tetrahydromethanopterin reductase-like flavin-dependent oxidoreductase (luciferase family)
MVEFGIQLAGPSAEEMGDRMDYMRALLDVAPDVYRSAWISDHLMKEDHPTWEAWTALTYFAALSPSYRFGHLVLAQSYRNPALLAKMAATLQAMTGGRAILGIGAGWQADEYLAYGYDYPDGSTRVAQLGEAIDVLRAMWTRSPATYEGTYYRITDAYCEPRPDPTIPILVGGRRPKLMRVAAEQADYWSWDGPIERYGPLVEKLRATCVEVGREWSTMGLHTSGEAYFPENPADFPQLDQAGGTMASVTTAQDPQGLYATELDWVLGPTPEDAIRSLRPVVETGVSMMTVYFHDRRSAAIFAREVAPAFA